MKNSYESPNVFKKDKGKDNEKRKQLKEFIKNSAYIEIDIQPDICRKFGLPYSRTLFQNEYRLRFFNYLLEHTTTVATVSKATEIPHKYLCECKAYCERLGLLKVVGFGICPTTGSKNVQFVSTNKETWDNAELFPIENQLKLFKE